MLFSVTIDTEEQWQWDAGFPVGEFGVQNIARLDRFHDLCQRYGIATTYFTNHAVLNDDSAAGVIQEISRTQHTEIGMHLHPWVTPPLTEQHNTGENSFLENLPADVARQKLENTYQLHRQRGFQPTSFRGGRYSSGPITQRFLFEHRFLADASICPYTTWEDAGAPDYHAHSERPVRLDAPADVDAPPLWSLPLTRVYSRQPFGFWNAVVTRIERSPLTKLRLIGILDTLGIARRIWLNFETESADRMLWLVRHASRLRLPYLCFTVHSSSLSVGPSPYAKNSEQVERIFDGIERVFQLLNSLPIYEPATISEIAIALEKQA